MRRISILFALVILVTSLASAEIFFSEQPASTYNLGGTINVPLTIKSTTNIYKVLQVNLLCGGADINFYKNGVGLTAGEEKNLQPSLILTKELINDLQGECTIKASLGSEYALTKKFTISSQLNIKIDSETSEVAPGETIKIKGTVSKQSTKNVDGFLEAQIFKKDQTGNESFLSETTTINNGAFTTEITAPADMPAGEYTLKIKAYEKDPSDLITNQGTTQTNLNVLQTPKNLEILVENPEVEPGTALKFSTILHDQTGENIDATVDVKIQNSKNKILERKDTQTGETFEYAISEDKSPENLRIVAESQGIKNEAQIKIKEKSDIKLQVINRTLIVTNTGNIPYCNKTILIKIGEEALNLNSCIDVGSEKRYALSAPDGEYKVEIIADEKTLEEDNVALTGKAIDIKEAASSVATLTRHPFTWLFVLGIFGIMVAMIYKKGYRKIFIGYINKRKAKKKIAEPTQAPTLKKITKKELITCPKAKMSLSIKGQKQKVSVACLKIKNYEEVQKNIEGTKETLTKISDLASQKKAVAYENGAETIFIFAPVKTKTFQNEIKALELAKGIISDLGYHNKIFKQKIKFGISLNNGEMVIKNEKVGFEFAAMGDIITKSKKIAALSNAEILLNENIKEKLDTKLKAQKIPNTTFYKIIEIKHEGKDSEKFIHNFIKRLEKEKK